MARKMTLARCISRVDYYNQIQSKGLRESVRLTINGYQPQTLEKVLNWVNFAIEDGKKFRTDYLKELKDQIEILIVERTVLE